MPPPTETTGLIEMTTIPIGHDEHARRRCRVEERNRFVAPEEDQCEAICDRPFVLVGTVLWCAWIVFWFVFSYRYFWTIIVETPNVGRHTVFNATGNTTGYLVLRDDSFFWGTDNYIVKKAGDRHHQHHQDINWTGVYQVHGDDDDESSESRKRLSLQTMQNVELALVDVTIPHWWSSKQRYSVEKDDVQTGGQVRADFAAVGRWWDAARSYSLNVLDGNHDGYRIVEEIHFGVWKWRVEKKLTGDVVATIRPDYGPHDENKRRRGGVKVAMVDGEDDIDILLVAIILDQTKGKEEENDEMH